MTYINLFQRSYNWLISLIMQTIVAVQLPSAVLLIQLVPMELHDLSRRLLMIERHRWIGGRRASVAVDAAELRLTEHHFSL